MLSEKQHQQAANNDYNFDHPDAFDFELLRKTIQRLKHFKNVQVPIYNFLTHSRETKTVRGQRTLFFSLVSPYFFKCILEREGRRSKVSANFMSSHRKLTLLQKTMYGANVIIFEGILTFYNPEICSVSLRFFFVSKISSGDG